MPFTIDFSLQRHLHYTQTTQGAESGLRVASGSSLAATVPEAAFKRGLTLAPICDVFLTLPQQMNLHNTQGVPGEFGETKGGQGYGATTTFRVLTRQLVARFQF